jgi:hypothetical protein
MTGGFRRVYTLGGRPLWNHELSLGILDIGEIGT